MACHSDGGMYYEQPHTACQTQTSCPWGSTSLAVGDTICTRGGHKATCQSDGHVAYVWPMEKCTFNCTWEGQQLNIGDTTCWRSAGYEVECKQSGITYAWPLKKC